MSFSVQLSEAMGPRWERHDDGSYTGTGFRQGEVRLVRKGKSWVMLVGGKEYGLGRRATFDTAEKKLATIPMVH